MNDVSVVIPTYNGAAFLAEALASVFAQTRCPCEVIVVDDCSTDATPELVAGIARTAPVPVTLLVLPRNSGGPAHPLNIGIAAAAGEFIAVLDQDDVFTRTKLAEQVNCLARHPGLALSFSLCGRYDQPDQPLQSPSLVAALKAQGGLVEGCRHLVGEDAFRLFLQHGNFVLGYPGMVFRRRHWQARGGLDEGLRVGSDYDFFCWLCLSGDAAFVEGIGYLRRLHASNLSAQRERMLIDLHRVQARYLEREPRVLEDAGLAAHLRECVFDLAYLLRQKGRYADALRTYWLSLRTWGWEARTVKGVAKLLPHWAHRRILAGPVAAGAAR
jgi:glycosyltransferase involved in cell wall biosynthesis